MESNSDKQLRDKLTGVEFPFDPQAWDKMEDMLDEKKKRRGFFWWWTGGIAAALLFAVVGYELGMSGGRLQVAGYRLNTETTAQNNSSEKPVFNNQRSEMNATTVLGDSNHQQTEGKQSAEDKGKSVNNNQLSEMHTTTMADRKQKDLKRTGHKSEGRGLRAEKKHTAQNQSESSDELIAQNFSGFNKAKRNNRHSSSAKDKLTQRKEETLAAFKSDESNVSGRSAIYNSNPIKQQTDLPAASATKDLLAKRIEMDGRAGFLESSEEENSFSKKNEESLPKAKRKIFNYSLGVLANVSGTVLGHEGSKEDSIKRAPAQWYNKVTYSAGLTHEFLFMNRIAITNSILYSRTGFGVNQPNAPADSASTTKSYTSTISELQIPIGIKVYPVVKKNFRFYLAASFVNHIKLSETFKVEKETYNPSLLTPNFDKTVVSVADNPFIEGVNNSVGSQGYENSGGKQAEYYGLGGLRRYYASFYASAGVEYILNRKFVFFTEPMFYMSLNKIGFQNKRKYNVGVSGGFRYQF